MERSEKIGLGVAGAGHLVLFGLLSVGFLATPNPVELKQQPIDVSLVADVGLEAQAPQAIEPPAPSVAPDTGPPEEAAPPAPEPAPPEPVPEPVPAPPQPQPRPQPKPAPRPAPKPVPALKPAPVAKPKPVTPAAAKAAPAKAQPTRRPAAAAAPSRAKPAATRGTGTTATATATRPRGSRLGDNFLKGISDQPSRSVSQTPRAAKIGAQALADIGSAILRQVQPCANRQVTPGPGAERIRVTINLRINRNGSLAAPPRIIGHDGVDDDNRRYVDRVDDLAIATFVGCSPLTGLPDELYDVPNGWRSFSLRYKLPG